MGLPPFFYLTSDVVFCIFLIGDFRLFQFFTTLASLYDWQFLYSFQSSFSRVVSSRLLDFRRPVPLWSLEHARGHWCRGLLSLLCTPIPPNGMAAVTRPHFGPLAPFLFTAILVFFGPVNRAFHQNPHAPDTIHEDPTTTSRTPPRIYRLETAYTSLW